MSDTGFLAFLAERRVLGGAKPAELRQAICARLPGDTRLGQNPPCSASAEGSDRKKFSQVCRGVSPPHGWRLDGCVSTYLTDSAVTFSKRPALISARHVERSRDIWERNLKAFPRDSSTSLRFARNDICETACRLAPPDIQ